MKKGSFKRRISDALKAIERPSAKDVEYTVDEVDLEMLKLLEEEHPWVTEDEYELVMDRLEKEHHFLQRIAATKIRKEEELPEECNICGEEETGNENFLVFCDGCNIGVHQDCYGVPNIPEGNWLCRPCLLSPNKRVSCVLCPETGGAYKKTSKGAWCHVLCGLFVNGARFENISFLEPVDVEDVPRNRNLCSICQTKKGGLVFCAYDGCRKGFHATCSIKSSYYIDVGNHIAYCCDHDPRKKSVEVSFLFTSPDTRYPTLETTPIIRKPIDLWEIKPRAFLSIERVSPKISHWIINRIAFRELQGREGASFLVKKIYHIWITRRNNGSIIKRLRVDTKPEGFAGWGCFIPCIPMGSLEEHQELVRAMNLLPEYQYPFQELHLYNLLVLGSHRVMEMLSSLDKTLRATKEAVSATEEGRVRALSKYIPGYQEMEVFLNHLKITDRHMVFYEEVTDDMAPGYSSIVTNPNCLMDIEKKLSQLEYKTMDTMLLDVYTMVQNAYAYNGIDSFVGKEALRIQKVFEQWKVKEKEVILTRLPPSPFLLYYVLPSSPDIPKDCLLIRSFLSKDEYFVERSKIHPLPRSHQELLLLLDELNQLTGITIEQEELQKTMIDALKHSMEL
ncbi:bromodomain and PHD finger-containing protein 1 [Nematocida sp. LUAm3]|nr:bromodomain and PHD finger-containing protein 1 [Nematocida sp. LUAm3]KAI5174545.1 bromodomain and PHD finger-containing protein 1 [Nematocida sp. LUAm2]KAI5178049.1 bromodomain and PHD finger-containing protein 1 [Nematocida sp. LUAm1]